MPADYEDHAAANSVSHTKRKYFHHTRVKGASRESLDAVKLDRADCAKALATECCKGRRCTSKFTMDEIIGVRKYTTIVCSPFCNYLKSNQLLVDLVTGLTTPWVVWTNRSSGSSGPTP